MDDIITVLVNDLASKTSRLRPYLDKIAKNGARAGIYTECQEDRGDGTEGEIYKLVHEAIVNVITSQNIADAIYRPVLNDIWLDQVKMVTGREDGTGYNAQMLQAALIELVKNAVKQG